METGPDFEINADTRIYYPQHDADAKRSAEMLSSYLAKVLNCSLPVVEENDTKVRGIHLCIDTALFEQQEAYRITVEPKRVALIGSDGAGLFYGVQTLRKRWPKAASFSLPGNDMKALRSVSCLMPSQSFRACA